jgi:FkbM family methyltransferase
MIQKIRGQLHFLKGERAFQRHPFRVILRLITWRLRCLLNLETVIRLDPGIRMKLIPEWRGISKMIFIFREDYEAELVWMRNYLKPGMTGVDGGAALGIWALSMAKCVGSEGRVLAFEPSAELSDLMEENIRLNQLGNIILYRKALGDREGTIRLYHTQDTMGAYSVAEAAGRNFEEIDMISLKSALEQSGAGQPDFIKFDLEGAEGITLRAAQSILGSDKPPVIMYEQHSEAQLQLSGNPHEAWEILRDKGYVQYRLGIRLNLIALNSPVQGGNVLALPAWLEN